MSATGEKRDASRLLEGIESGGLPAMNAAALAERLDPVLVYAIVTYLRAIHPASDPAATPVLERVVQFLSASPALVRKHSVCCRHRLRGEPDRRPRAGFERHAGGHRGRHLSQASAPIAGLSAASLQSLPGFPVKAYRDGYREGRVKLGYTINADGAVGDVQVLEAFPVQVFTRSAANAVAGWRFAPTGASEQRTVEFRFIAV